MRKAIFAPKYGQTRASGMYTDIRNRGVVRTGATGAMAPVDFENMCFGTRRFKTKRLKNHREMPAKTIFSCTKSVIDTC